MQVVNSQWRRGRVRLNALVLKTSEGLALQRFESSRLRMYFLPIEEKRKNINADC